jgi:predicted HicB family RNase H-like nuclease
MQHSTDLHLRLPPELLDRLRRLARREGRSVNNLIVHRLDLATRAVSEEPLVRHAGG